MAEQICCVCVEEARPGIKIINGRWFCDEHYTKATYKRSGVWRSGAVAVVGLLLFVAAVVALDTFLQPDLTGPLLLLTGVGLAIIPAALWLIFFYQQDRLEPEPVGQVARMFVIGLALAGAIGIPVTDQLFRVQEWLYRDDLTTLLGSIFVIGAVEAFIIFATVRYFIFDSAEFDERTDGVIYATAAGLGYATALNLQFILANGGAALGTGEIFVAEVALAQAAFGGLLGYFLGRAKLEREPVWWLSAALVLTAVLNGVFNVLRGQFDSGTITIGTQSGGFPFLTGLLLAGGLAVSVTLVVSFLINRDIARSLRDQQPAATSDPTVGDRQANYAVIGSFVVLLLIGGLAWNNAVNRTKSFDLNGFRGVYPAYYSDATGAGDVLRVADTSGAGAEFAIVTLEAGQDVDSAEAQLTAERSTDYLLYKVLSQSTAVVNGKNASVQRFAYVEPNGLTGALPQVREGLDYIFAEGGQTVVVTLLTTPDDRASVEPLFARFLNHLSFP
jgi:RsiW-degrading membrane proteinase PrsW (M82 family)